MRSIARAGLTNEDEASSPRRFPRAPARFRSAMTPRFPGLILSAIALLCFAGCQSRRAEPAGPRHVTLERKIVVGYQGWYRTPGDGSDMGWWHYRGKPGDRFEPGRLGIDYWPDVSELAPAERFATPFKHPD